MKNRRVRLATPLWLTVATSIAFMSLMAMPTPARQGTPPPSGSYDPFAEVRERQRREATLRSAEIRPGKTPDDPRRAQVILDHLRQDFKRLQIIRNEIVHSMKTNETLDYGHLSDQTAEITKRAARMRTSLALPAHDGVDKARLNQTEFNQEQLKSALVKLCNGIASFVESPVFKSPGVSNVQESAATGHLLQNIIVLSSDIRKSAEKLKKVK